MIAQPAPGSRPQEWQRRCRAEGRQRRCRACRWPEEQHSVRFPWQLEWIPSSPSLSPQPSLPPICVAAKPAARQMQLWYRGPVAASLVLVAAVQPPLPRRTPCPGLLRCHRGGMHPPRLRRYSYSKGSLHCWLGTAATRDRRQEGPAARECKASSDVACQRLEQSS